MAAPQRKLHVTNSKGRNATVVFGSVKPPAGPKLGVPGSEVRFLRFLASTSGGLHEALQHALGEDYAQALIDADPEIDLEQVGRTIGDTSTVYLSADGKVLHAAPRQIELILDAEGHEKERRDWEDKQANVNDELPVRWTGRRMPKAEAVRRFVFSRTVELAHVDGLTYDYLYGMAKELADEDAMMLMGGGPKGRDALVFQTNGTPYRAFLEGRVDGARYKLLLHLSNMELKRPAPKGADGAKEEGES
ncbi:MAG: hypothetical protein KF901_23670 [Myxococcales bacterium]|nr:hypothetical protein [Myxococcales bacterium]